MTESNTKIISLYSYKGGVGRTQLTVNLASYLCFIKRKKILVIDWDLEAPGLHYFFKTSKGNLINDKKGVIDLFTSFIEKMEPIVDIEGNELPLFDDYIINVASSTPKNGDLGVIDLVTAGDFSDDYKPYKQKINSFPWGDFYTKYDGATYIEILKKTLQNSTYDFVFLDSRTGVSDYLNVVNVQFPDINILVMAPTQQNIDGSLRIAKSIEAAKYVTSRHREPIIMPILSKIDASIEHKLEKWSNIFKTHFYYYIEQFNKYSGNEDSLNDFVNRTTLDYKRDLSFGEQKLFDENSNEYEMHEKSLAKQYSLIANYLLDIKEDKDIKEDTIYSKDALRSNQLDRKNIFFFGRAGVGKSTFLAMLIHTIGRNKNLGIDFDPTNKQGGDYLIELIEEKLNKNIFPSLNEIEKVHYSTFSIGFTEQPKAKPFNFSSYDFSGQDLMFLSDVEEEKLNTFNRSVISTLRTAHIVLIFTDVDSAKKDDYKILKFLGEYRLLKKEQTIQTNIALIITKWDKKSNDISIGDFVEEYLPNTSSSLKMMQNTKIFPFSVGEVEENTEGNTIKKIDTQYTADILNWILFPE